MSVSIHVNGKKKKNQKTNKKKKPNKTTRIYTQFSLLNIFQFMIGLKAFSVINKFLKVFLSYLFCLFVCLFFSYFSILNITQTPKSNRAWTIKVNSNLSIGIIFCIMFSAIYTFRFQILHEYFRAGSPQNFPHSGFTWTCCVNKCCSIKERCNLMTAICYILITFISHWEGSENA